MSSNLPTGVLTFLFTDIQGSTPLWEKDPAGMREALDLHNLVIAAALEGMACIAAVQKEPQRALKLAAAAAELRENSNFPASAARDQLIEHALAPAREMLGEEASESAWQLGMALPLDDAVNYALDLS